MTLLELRRYAIRSRTRVRFSLEPAGECVVNEHGVLKIPSLRSVPDFNVEALLGSVEQFVLDPVQPAAKQQKVSREQLQSLLGAGPKADPGHEE
jgi:hypothetical protein